MQKSRS